MNELYCPYCPMEWVTTDFDDLQTCPVCDSLLVKIEEEIYDV